MPLLLDNVKVATATTGTGSTIAIGSAVSTHQTPAEAGAVNGMIYRYRIDDNTDWEIGTVVYDSGTPQFTNRTVIRSTNSDSALNLSGNATISIVASQLDIKLTNSSITPTTANVSAAIGYRYFADISGLTADRNFVLPACQAGDEIELKITVGDATYELVIIGDTGVSIEGGSAATEWSRLFITGEIIKLVADGSNSWRVVFDGRIPCKGLVVLTSNDTTNSATTDTLPTWDTAEINVGDICDLTNKRMNIRRAGNYKIYGSWRPANNTTDQNIYRSVTYKNGTGGTLISLTWQQGSGANTTLNAPLPPKSVSCAVGDYLDFYYYTQAANVGANATGTWFEVVEE